MYMQREGGSGGYCATSDNVTWRCISYSSCRTRKFDLTDNTPSMRSSLFSVIKEREYLRTYKKEWTGISFEK